MADEESTSQPQPEEGPRRSPVSRWRRRGIGGGLLTSGGAFMVHAIGGPESLLVSLGIAAVGGGGALVYHLPKIRRHFNDGRRPPKPGRERGGLFRRGPRGAGPGRKVPGPGMRRAGTARSPFGGRASRSSVPRRAGLSRSGSGPARRARSGFPGRATGPRAAGTAHRGSRARPGRARPGRASAARRAEAARAPGTQAAPGLSGNGSATRAADRDGAQQLRLGHVRRDRAPGGLPEPRSVPAPASAGPAVPGPQAREDPAATGAAGHGAFSAGARRCRLPAAGHVLPRARPLAALRRRDAMLRARHAADGGSGAVLALP
jgi:hypothetical protein